ncbi:uncharacterized protein V2V93DRAFT_363534 [Kockiozyma suomiensis]|uniref:uncharacterized protein n=1 Tax=Kockiozyma suomiensis TaxID=1337062 RepID=UPI003343BC69
MTMHRSSQELFSASSVDFTSDHPVILPSAHGPVLHPSHLAPQVLQPRAMPPRQQFSGPAMSHHSNESDIFFTSLVTDGRSHVIDQHASTGVDELDNLEFFNTHMISHPWMEAAKQPLSESPQYRDSGGSVGSVAENGNKNDERKPSEKKTSESSGTGESGESGESVKRKEDEGVDGGGDGEDSDWM